MELDWKDFQLGGNKGKNCSELRINSPGKRGAMNLELEYDVIVVGAGVAGLAAGAASARGGAKTLVVDAADEIARKVKGEVLKAENTIIERILGKPIPQELVNGISKRRRIYSPSCKKQMLNEPKAESILIEYRPFLHEVAKACVESGATLALNTEVDGIVLNDREEVCGIECTTPAGEKITLSSKAVVAADGHSSRLREQAKLAAPNACATYKVVVEGASIPDDDVLEFMLINNPAGAIWIFPKGGGSAECGITIWDQSAEAQNADLAEVWEKYRDEHPILSERLKGASYTLTSIDKLIFGGLVREFVRPGFVMVGDAAGHVGATGASGILAGLSMGYEAGEFLGGYAVKEGKIPDKTAMDECMETMKDTDTWRMLEEEEKAGDMTRQFLFKILGTNEEIDNAWDAIMEMA
jgi:digeranylgeranylglycerophospholipid reductase